MLLSCDLDKNGKVWTRSNAYPKLSDEQMDELMSEVKKKNLVKKRKLHESGSNEIVSDWHDECEKK